MYYLSLHIVPLWLQAIFGSTEVPNNGVGILYMILRRGVCDPMHYALFKNCGFEFYVTDFGFKMQLIYGPNLVFVTP